VIRPWRCDRLRQESAPQDVPVAGTGAGPRSEPAVAIDSATRRHGELVVFENLTLSVDPQEIVCLVGPSGCGKTTLLRCIDGLIPLHSGSIRIHGTPVTAPRPDVAMVFQHFGLLPWKTVVDNVAYGLALRGVPTAERRRVAMHYLELVGLADFAGKYPYQLSGGMQQRVGLARALAVNPTVLLMDEPFASIDALSREILQQELLRIMERERKTIIFITHSIDEAIVLGHRVVVLTRLPARVKADLRVDLPFPRDVERVKEDPVYMDLRAHVWELIRTEAQPGTGRAGTPR
jgi:NitT/TauT family transport system ATP-binding protein